MSQSYLLQYRCMGDKAARLGLVLVHCGELGVSGWEIASGKQQSQRMWSRSVAVGTAAHSCTWDLGRCTWGQTSLQDWQGNVVERKG